MGGYIALLVVGVLVLIFFITTINKRNGIKDSIDRMRYGRGFERVEGIIMLCFWVGGILFILVSIVAAILNMAGFW